MAPSQSTEDPSLQDAESDYLNETSEPDRDCSPNVPATPNDIVELPGCGCQPEASGPTKTTSTVIVLSPNMTRTVAAARIDMQGKTDNDIRSIAKHKPDENNDKSLSRTSEEDCSPESEEVEPPDGGWGYVVLVGAFIVLFIYGLLSNCFGILFTGFLLEARVSLTTITALSNTQSSIMTLSWLLAGPLVHRWGWRVVVMCSSILCTFGMVMTAFTPSVDMMFFSYSLLTGLGNGLCYVAALAMPAFYFKRRRGKANAAVLSGTNAGSAVGPILVSFLQLQYGFRGATLITAAVTLHACFSAIVFHPVQWHSRGRCNVKAGAPVEIKKDESMIKALTSYWRLLKSLRTYPLVISFGIMFGVLRTYLSLVPLVLEEKGYSQNEAAYVTSICGICGFVSRIVVSWLADTSWFNLRVACMVSLTVVMVSLTVFSLMERLLWLTVATALFGCGIDATYIIQNLMTANYLGLKNMVPLLALSGITSAVWLLSSNPLFGVFQTLSGDYSGPILFLASQTLFSLLLTLLMPMAEVLDKKIMKP